MQIKIIMIIMMIFFLFSFILNRNFCSIQAALFFCHYHSMLLFSFKDKKNYILQQNKVKNEKKNLNLNSRIDE